MTKPPPDAAQWLPAARAGCNEALGQVLEQCRRFLLRIATKELDPALKAKGGASDLVQLTFLEAQRDFARFHGDSEGELRAWLRRLLIDNLANFRRRFSGTAKRQVGREVALEAGSAVSSRGGGLYAATPSPSAEAIAHERAEALQRSLARLPEDYRQVITLRHQEQRSFEEIGRVMQRSPDAARKLWTRAIERLRGELDAPP
jgi:RNA polymerase sigma-70 factor (ECF subfamily)